MADKKDGFFSLKNLFRIAVVAIPLAIGVNVFWQLALDPTFFPWIHDTTNVTAQALTMKMESFRHAALWAFGLEGDGPLSGIMQAWLEPEVNQILAERTVDSIALENMGDQLLSGMEL